MVRREKALPGRSNVRPFLQREGLKYGVKRADSPDEALLKIGFLRTISGCKEVDRGTSPIRKDLGSGSTKGGRPYHLHRRIAP